MNIAMIIAGGKGVRTHQDIPKQFLSIHDRPVIVYTMQAFQKHPEIDAILVVCIDGWQEILWAYVRQFNITKTVADTDVGKEIRENIVDLEKLLCAYREGTIVERQ